MVACSVIAGSEPSPAEEPTLMVFTPVPGMAKFMVSAPGVKLASSMAALSEHEPPNPQKPSPISVSWKSAVEFTTKVVSAGAGAAFAMPQAIIAATSIPAASAFAFVPHTCPRPPVWVLMPVLLPAASLLERRLALCVWKHCRIRQGVLHRQGYL